MGSSRSCFSVHNTTLSWDDALLGCALDNGTLASIDSREEADLIVGLLTSRDIRNTWLVRPNTDMMMCSKSVLLQQNTTKNAICIGYCKLHLWCNDYLLYKGEFESLLSLWNKYFHTCEQITLKLNIKCPKLI